MLLHHCSNSTDQIETPANCTYKILGTIQCSSGCDSDDAHEEFLKKAVDHFTNLYQNISLPLQSGGVLIMTTVTCRSFYYYLPGEHLIYHIEIEESYELTEGHPQVLDQFKAHLFDLTRILSNTTHMLNMQSFRSLLSTYLDY